jgi:hypothetical protein
VRPASLSKNPRLMFDTHRAVLERAYARCGAGRPDGLEWDASGARLSRAVRRAGLFYATVEALVGTDAGRAACEIVSEAVGADDAGVRGAVAAREAGAAAAWALIFGLGIGPATCVARRDSWTEPLRGWWTIGVRDGWLRQENQDAALAALVSEMIDTDAIADALLDAAGGAGAAGAAEGIVAVGFGQNGRVLARRAAARGVTLEARDDRVPGLARIDAPMPAGVPVIVTPDEDAAILARLPGRACIVRWREQRSRLAAEMLRAILPAWNAQAASSGSTIRQTPSVASR